MNTSDYQFEEDEPAGAAAKRRRLTPTAASTAAAAAAKALAEAPPLTGPLRYDTRFMADNVSTPLTVDPLLGLGLQFQAALTDVLENQRIDASLFGLFDLRTSNIRASYTNLTQRYDWSIAYQKQAYFFDFDRRPLPLRPPRSGAHHRLPAHPQPERARRPPLREHFPHPAGRCVDGETTRAATTWATTASWCSTTALPPA